MIIDSLEFLESLICEKYQISRKEIMIRPVCINFRVDNPSADPVELEIVKADIKKKYFGNLQVTDCTTSVILFNDGEIAGKRTSVLNEWNEVLMESVLFDTLISQGQAGISTFRGVFIGWEVLFLDR